MLCIPRLELAELVSVLLRCGEAGEVWLGVELGVKPGYIARLGSAQGIVTSDFLSVYGAGLLVCEL